MPPATCTTIDIALLSTPPSRKMHLRDVFYSKVLDFTPTKPYLSDESFYKELSVQMGKRNRSSGLFVNNASQYTEILHILKTRYHTTTSSPDSISADDTQKTYSGFTLSHDQSDLVVFRTNDKNCHLKKCLLASQIFNQLFEFFTTYKLDFMHHAPEKVYIKLMESDKIVHAISEAGVQSFSTLANATLAHYATPPLCHNHPYHQHHPSAFINDYMPPSNPYYTPPVMMNASMPPYCIPPMMISGFMPGEKEYLMEQNRLQQIQIMNVIKDRDETVDKLTLEASALRKALDRAELAELHHNKDMQSFAATQNKQQQAEIMNIITQRDEKNEKLTAETCTLRKAIAGHKSREQHQSKEMESLLAKQQILEKDKEDLMEQNKQQQDEIMNLMTQCGDATNDKSTTLVPRPATLCATSANYERKEKQQITKEAEILLAKKQILEKEKEDLMEQNEQQQAKILHLIKHQDETRDTHRATIADYEREEKRQIAEVESLLAKNQILEKEKEDLIKQNKRILADMANLVKQHDETMADYERKAQQQGRELESLLATKQILEKENEGLVKLDTQRKDEMTTLVRQHDEAQTSSNGQIASLRAAIADYERKLQQQKKHDKALKDQIDCTHEQQEEDSSSLKPETASDFRPSTRRIHHDGPIEIVVSGAGTPEVNGVYSQDGYSEKAFRYSRRGAWEGKTCMFYILQCQLSNNKKYWYITIVPDGFHPGTMGDIDFYFAPVTKACRRMPPLKGWVKDDKGGGLPPTLTYRMSNERSREQGKGSLSASRPFVSPARTAALETQNQESSKPSAVSEQTWTKRNALLIEENNKRHRADLDELIQQHDEKEKISKAEINALRATITAYERKEIAQLKARIEVLRGKAGHYEQKEKKAKLALQEMVALEEKLTRQGLEVRNDDDTLLVHETPPSRNAKRARREAGQDGEVESLVCNQQG